MGMHEARFAETEGQGIEQEERRAPSGSASSRSAGCCGFGATEMMWGCPCGAILKRHRRALWLAMAGMALGFLILQAGWVLGVIAFFRSF